MIVPRAPADAAEVARHYDELDRFYRELWGEHLHHGLWETGRETPERAAERLAERVAEAAELSPGDAVCDVGCGYGGTSRLLAARGARVTGVTVSPAQHAHAVRGSPDGDPTFLLRDWLRSGLPDASFDAAVAVESIEHMADRAAAFAEVARVLRPGGRLVVCAWLAADRPSALEVRALLEPICREGRLPGLGTGTEHLRWMEDAGLRVERMEDWSDRVARTWTVCAVRLARALLREPAYRRHLLDPRNPNRVFALTLLRIRTAYAAGSMRYGFFVARRA